MLQLATLRSKTEWVKERLSIKNFKETDLVDQILSLDEERKKLNFRFDETKARINTLSKEIGQLMAKGNKEDAEGKKKEVEALKNELGPVQQNLEAAEQQVNDLLVRLPN